MDKRKISEYITKIAEDVIRNDLTYLNNANCTVLFLTSEHPKKSSKRAVLGECEKVPEKYKWAVPADFIITIFEPNTEDLTEAQMRILVKHELMHIGITDDADPSFYIVPHDVEDFSEILKEYGIGWEK